MTFQVKFSKYKVKWPLLPPWITFAMSSKWKCFLHQSYNSFNPTQFGHKLDIIWISYDRVVDFISWGKLLVQWWWSKMTYNVSSWHMTLQVIFDISQRIKVGEDILKLIMRLGWPSSHKNWASYDTWKLAF